MKLIGTGRLGRDIEMSYSSAGLPIGKLAVAWNYGRKGEDGKRPTQWARLTIFGNQAEKLAPYLLKGQQIFAVADDCRVETYEKRDGGTGVSLDASVSSIELIGSRPEGGGQQERPAAAPKPQARPAAAPKPAASSGFDDMDDDIPF